MANLQVVKQAQLVFIVFCAMLIVPVTAALACVFSWRYEAVIERQKATITYQDEHLSALCQPANASKPVLPSWGPADEQASRRPRQESGLTPKQFMSLYQNKPPIEARGATKLFANELMHFQGTLSYPVQPEGAGYLVLINDIDGISIGCEFGPDFEAKARMLKINDTLTGKGVIRSSQNGDGVALIDCLP